MRAYISFKFKPGTPEQDVESTVDQIGKLTGVFNVSAISPADLTHMACVKDESLTADVLNGINAFNSIEYAQIESRRRLVR